MRLTEHQADVYRTILAEELAAGRSADVAALAAYDFMREEALPDWHNFWRDWNRPPGPIEQMLHATVALATASIVCRRATAVSGLLDRTSQAVAAALRSLS